MNTRIALITIISVIFASTKTNAQSSTGKISGQIITAENVPARVATLRLMKAKDSALVKINQADSNGRFIFEQVQYGDYRLWITHAGFYKYTSDVIHIDSLVSLKDLSPITLQADVKSLQEVEVVSKKSFIEHKIDRTVVNVSNMISTTGDNALEVLGKLPAVIVDPNGSISFKGKQGVLILINGKETYLSGDNLANYLKSLSAAQLDQVELMPNPPAKFEAAGNAGVINIKMKRMKKKGFNGNLALSIGKSRAWRNNESLSINYRSGKISLFANAGYSIQNSKRKLDLQRNYFDSMAKLVTAYKSVTWFKPRTHTLNLKTGLDYYLSPKTTLGIVFTGGISTSNTYNPANSHISNNAGILDSSIVADMRSKNKFNNGGVTLSYSHQFDSLGKSLTLDVDYVKYKLSADQRFVNSINYPHGSLKNVQEITAYLPADINIYSAKTDFTQPLRQKANLEAGAKVSYVSTDNEANYFLITQNTPIIDYNYTNHFLYKENINAVYASFRKEWRRLSLQTGLRMENTHVRGKQLGNPVRPDSVFTQHYTNLFPTAYLLYKLDSIGKHSLRASYGKRIDRPYYKDLNPFVTIVDKFTNFSGNPYLKPQLATTYELTYNYKNNVSLALYYSQTKNFQTETVRQQGDVFISSTMNLGSRQYKAINASVNFKPVKWWSSNLYSEAVNLRFTSSLFDQHFTAQKTYYYVESNNQFELPANWSLELSGYYISSRIVGQFNLDPRGSLNMAVQKRILKKKASLKLSASDILATTFSSGTISNIRGATSRYHNDFDNRMVSLGFSYNFGSSSNDERRRSRGSLQNEQNRVKN